MRRLVEFIIFKGRLIRGGLWNLLYSKGGLYEEACGIYYIQREAYTTRLVEFIIFKGRLIRGGL